MKGFFNILIFLFVSATVSAQISNSGYMGISAGTVISYGGNWINTGLPNIGTGTVVFNGLSAQTIKGTTTWDNLVINNPLGVSIDSGSQYVRSVLYPTSGTLTTDSLLTLLSVSGQTALIAGTGSGDISGYVNMQRFLAPDTAWGYKHFSSPFTLANGADISQFSNYMNLILGTVSDSPFPTFWQYIETNPSTVFDSGWVAPTTTVMQPMMGYTANFGSDSTNSETVTLTGYVNSGAVSTPVYYTNSGNLNSDGWNLVGNPYPSPINWDAHGWTKTNVVNGFSIYNATGQFTGYYGCYSGVTGLGTHNTTSLIPSMHGFFVKATANGVLGVTDSVRAIDLNPNPHFSKKAPYSNSKILRLNAVENTSKSIPDDLVIDFNSGTANATGIEKLWNTDSHIPSFYSIRNSNVYLAINEFKEFNNDTDIVIPLGIAVGTNNSYKIYASEISNFSPETKIYLQDKSTGIVQDLTQNPEYTFNINSGDPHSGRFYLIFSLKANINEISNNNTDIFTAYSTGNELTVNYYNEDPGNMNIYNTLGQIILRNNKVNKGLNKFNLNLSHGYYFIQITSGDKISNKKIYINNY